jgi:DNA-binding GntR family transcriptional regulator
MIQGHYPCSGDSQARQAWFALENQIATGQLQPGQWLSEQSLSQHLGLGRTPVREALQRLAADNLVDIVPRRGTVVRDVRVEDQLRILEVRRPLERLLARRAALLTTPGQRQDLLHFSSLCLSALERGAAVEAMQANRAYCMALWYSTDNSFLIQAIGPLYASNRRFFFLMAPPEELQRNAVCHAAVAEAVAAGDVAGAEQAADRLMDQLDRAARTILNHRLAGGLNPPLPTDGLAA